MADLGCSHSASVQRQIWWHSLVFLHEFSFDDSVRSAETETEVERTSAISSEVQSLSQNLEKGHVWPELGLGQDIWDPVAGHNPDDA